MVAKRVATGFVFLSIVGCGSGGGQAPDEQSTVQTLQAETLGGSHQPECDLLHDPAILKRMGAGLEHKLETICAEAPAESAEAPLPQVLRQLPESLAPAPPGLDIPVSDPNLDVGGSTQSETTVAVRDNVVCAAWNDAGEGFGLNGFSGFGYSLDGGQTFTDGGPFPDGPNDTNFGDPSLAYSVRDDAFYYAALSSVGLSLWRSTNDCQSFEYVAPIANHGGGDDKELIAVDNSPTSPFFGRIYVGWTDFSMFLSFGDLNVVAYSDDGGQTFSERVSLPGTGFDGQGVYPAVAPNGDVYMALVNMAFEIGGVQDQWIFRSTDGGVSWVKAADIGTGQLQPENPDASASCGRQALTGDIRNLSSPQIAISPDPDAQAGYVVHALYPYDSDGDGPDQSNVFYRRSVDGAASWSDEVQVNDDGTTTDQFYPALGLGEGGVLVASWYDRRLDPDNNTLFDRFAAFSTDDGLTFSSNVRISDVSSPVAQTNPNFDGLAPCYHGDYDQVAVGADNVAHIVWSDDRREMPPSGPNPDVYYDALVINPSLGRLRPTRSGVNCMGTVEFVLSDADLEGAGAQSISVGTGIGDAEVLVLTEDPSNLGTFRGSLATSADAVTPGNGVLEVEHGTAITATYNDADDGTGNPAVASATVSVDCQPPAIDVVDVLSTSGAAATVGVRASEAIRLRVDYGLSCDALENSVLASNLTKSPRVTLKPLSPATTYFFAVTGTDAAGNVTRDDRGGACYLATTLARVYTEDFENGLGGFEIDNDAGAGNGLWHLSTACAASEPGHSLPTTLYYGIDDFCNFDNGLTNEGIATSPVVHLDDTSLATLEFNYFLGTEGGGFFDRASVEVSVNGGEFIVVDSNFVQLFAHRFIRTRPDAVAAGRDALLENTGRWQHAVTDLGPFLGTASSADIQVRFRFDSGDATVNEFEGFHVDDVELFTQVANMPCLTDSDCNDHRFCSGDETCADGLCVDGTPVSCPDDGIECTLNRCDEAAQGCVALPNDALCDDGLDCTGFEFCDPAVGCQSTGNPCDDGIACTEDVCEELGPDAGVSCEVVPVDSACDDGLFCTGVEHCEPFVGCKTTGDPCPGPDTCDEAGDQCLPTCFTDTNQNHESAGRAFHNGRRNRSQFFAVGSNDALGKAPDVTSLQGGDGFWQRVTSCPAPPSIDSFDLQVVGSEVTVSGTASDPNQDLSFVRVTFLVFDSFPFSVIATGTENWTAEIGLPEGFHEVEVQAFDATGLASPVVGPIGIFILSPVAPTITSSEVSVSGDSVTVSGTAFDLNNDLLFVQIAILQDGELVASTVATGTDSWTGTVSGLAAGSYTARAQAFDREGLLSEAVEQAFEITDATICVEDTNLNHTAAGRATFQRRRYRAVGSNDDLGKNGSTVTALRGSAGFWEKVAKCP